MLKLLTGIRVVDLTTIVYGPMVGQTLADYGAEVIKVEPPAGDLARFSGPGGAEGMSAMYAGVNRNKTLAVLDLKNAEGRAGLRSLLTGADVFLHNMRPEKIAALGFDPETVQGLNPDIIYCAMTGFGAGGPYAGRPAYDDVIQAAGGLAGLSIETGGAPAFAPTIAADKIAALYAGQAVLAALVRRMREGAGCVIEAPMFECLVAFLMIEHLGAAAWEAEGAPGYGRLLNPHRRPHRTADGWIAIMPYSETHWRRILTEIGREDLVAAAWFADPTARNLRSGDLYAAIGAAMPGRSTADWQAALTRLDLPHAPVARLAELLSDPHLLAQDFFAPHPGMAGSVRATAQPVRFEGVETAPDAPPPAWEGRRG